MVYKNSDEFVGIPLHFDDFADFCKEILWNLMIMMMVMISLFFVTVA